MSPTVAELACYPVKSCAGVAVDEFELTAAGPRHDRRFLVVRATDGRYLSQREIPSMAVVRPRIAPGGDEITFTAPVAEPSTLAVRFDGPRRDVSLFGRWFGTGVDQGDDIAGWLSEVLGQPCRLVRTPPDHDRQGSGANSSPVGFSDSTALLVIARSSLDDLNQRILERGGEPVPMNRFRPNLVVAGWPEPYTEDTVRRMTIADAEIGYAKLCVRCQMPTIEQSTGRWDGPEPTRTLRTYRRDADRGVIFGVKAAVLRPGTIRLGDEVTVTESVRPRLPGTAVPPRDTAPPTAAASPC